MRSADARQSSRAGFTRNLENAVPLGFANDVKIPQRVTRASLSRAEHAYEFCDRLCSHQRDVVGGIQSRSSPCAPRRKRPSSRVKLLDHSVSTPSRHRKRWLEQLAKLDQMV
jgi:hypothetical protein